MENKNILHGIIGLLVGILITSCFYSFHHSRNYKYKGMMHQMPNGEMMSNGPMGMDDAMGSMMIGLQGKTGDAFDQAFLSEMIMHHQGAVAMAQAVLKTSKRPELIKLANDIISAQTKEIEMMQSWQKTWFR